MVSGSYYEYAPSGLTDSLVADAARKRLEQRRADSELRGGR